MDFMLEEELIDLYTFCLQKYDRQSREILAQPNQTVSIFNQ
jgi:hypothetical protein